VPRSVSISVTGAMVIYSLTAFSVSGVARLDDLDGDTALAEAFSTRGLEWVTYIIYICALIGITAASFTNIMS